MWNGISTIAKAGMHNCCKERRRDADIVWFKVEALIERMRRTSNWSLLTKARLNIPAAARDMKNEHIFFLKPVEDEVLAHRKTAQPRPQIAIAAAPFWAT
jgi:hypothetical protein